jgi:hypothetical protein
VTYYAHTATRSDGPPDPDILRWQLLRDHLRNVARLMKCFASPFGLAEEAELVGLF